MEYKSDKLDNNARTPAEDVLANTTSHSEITDKDVSQKLMTRASSDDSKAKIAVEWKGEENCPKGTSHKDTDAFGDVIMGASVTADDVIRAGGFGARDDISSFLPVASDSTDFEASIRDARDYEEPQGVVSRPGLGWTGSTKGE